MVLAPAAGAATGTPWVERIRNAIATGAILCRDGSVRMSVALRWSRGCTGPSLGAQPGEQRVGSRCSVEGRAPHATAPPAARTPPSTARQDPADRVGAEPTVLDIAPAVDLAKHRAVAAIGGLHPILQRLHRTSTERRDASHGDGAVARLTAENEVDADFDEMDLLDVEADQCGTAEPGGTQQQQSPIAQTGEITRTSGRHAGESSHRRWKCPPTCGGAASVPQQRRHRLVGCGRGQPVLAMLGSDRGGRRANAPALKLVGERREIGCDRGGDRRQRRCASVATPGHERRPVTRIKPQCFRRR